MEKRLLYIMLLAFVTGFNSQFRNHIINPNVDQMWITDFENFLIAMVFKSLPGVQFPHLIKLPLVHFWGMNGELFFCC